VIAAARQTGGLITLERQERREVRFWAAAIALVTWEVATTGAGHGFNENRFLPEHE